MTTNLLTPEQASFETGISGWEAVDSDPTAATTVPRNLLTEEQATFATNYSTQAGRVCGWYLNGSGATEGWDSATPCAKWTATTTGGKQFRLAENVYFPATPGLTYTYMARFRSVGFASYATMSWLTSADAPIGTSVNTTVTMKPDWTDVRLTGVVPAGAAKVYISLTVNITAVGQVFEITRAALYEGDVPDWHAPSESWAKNLLSDEQARMETNVVNDGTNKLAAGWYNLLQTYIVGWTTEQAYEGTHSLKLTHPNTSWTKAAAGVGPPAGYREFPATPGQGYSAVAMLRPPREPPSTHQLYLEFIDDAAVAKGTVQGNSLSPTAGWRQVWVRGICPTGATKFRVVAGTGPITAPEAGYLDKAAVYNGYVGAWFDVRTVTIAQATDTAPHGTKVLAITRLAPTGVGEARTTTAITATPGKRYTAMADFASATGRPSRVYLEFLDGAGTVVSSMVGTVTPATTGYSQAIVPGVCPTGASRVRMRVLAVGMDQNEVLKVDRAGLMDGDTTEWAPGGGTVPPSVAGTPDPYRHRMAVVARDLPSDAPISAERILPGGRVEPVRHVTAVVPTGGIATFDDYDVPTDVPYQYRITQNGVVVATSPQMVLPSADTFWLGEPNTGAMQRVIPAANAIPEWSREAPTGVHRVLGRQDPIVVTDRRWWAEGELTVYTLTDDQRVALGDLYSLGTTLGFYGPQAILGGIGRIYVVAPHVDERRVSARGYETPREWRADVTQVAEPTGAASVPLVVTWAAVVDAYDRWSDVPAGEFDWLDVMSGVPGYEPAGSGSDVGWEW